MDAYFRKAVGNEGLLLPGYLVPTCDVGLKIITRMDEAAREEAWVEHVIGRNPLNHKRFFAFVKQTFHMQDEYQNMKVWLQRVKWMAGHFDTFLNPDGQLIYVVKSIRFDALKEDEFRVLFKNAVNGFLDFYNQENWASMRQQNRFRLTEDQFLGILDYV